MSKTFFQKCAENRHAGRARAREKNEISVNVTEMSSLEKVESMRIRGGKYWLTYIFYKSFANKNMCQR